MEINIGALLLGVLSWFVWLLWKLFIGLIWDWPLLVKIVLWPLVIMTILRARREYKNAGGGLIAFWKATWFAITTVPGTVNAFAKWLTQQVIMNYGLYTQTDVLSKLPEPIRKWLGHAPTEVKIVEVEVEKIVEVVKWEPLPFYVRARDSAIACVIGIVIGGVLFGLVFR